MRNMKTAAKLMAEAFTLLLADVTAARVKAEKPAARKGRGAAKGKVKGKARGRRGPKAGGTFAGKPCPVCGEINKARRYSYHCEKHRSAALAAPAVEVASEEAAS